MTHFKTVLFFFLVMGPAHAVIIDFTDGAGNGLTSFSKTVDGITVTFNNVLNESGGDTFFNLSNGLGLGSGGLGFTWDFVFDQTVEFSEFTTGFFLGITDFSITGAGVNIPSAAPVSGTNALPTLLTLIGGEVYNFTAVARNIGGPGLGGVIFSDWTVTTTSSSVPVPAAVWLFGSGLVGLIGMRKNH